MKSTFLKTSVLVIFSILFSFCTKETKDKEVSKNIKSEKIIERGACCGSATITITRSAYDFQIMYLTTAGWQTTGCLSKNTPSVTVGGCCPDGSVLLVVALPCGANAPANFGSGDFSATITANGNTYGMVYLSVIFTTPIPGYPSTFTCWHYEVPIC